MHSFRYFFCFVFLHWWLVAIVIAERYHFPENCCIQPCPVATLFLQMLISMPMSHILAMSSPSLDDRLKRSIS